jgi:Rrf2 family protein
MRITRETEYAVRCVLYLMTRGDDEVVRRDEIAGEMDIPDQFLRKIAQRLSRAGFMEIVQGPKGGFRLTASPDKLTLLDVVEAITGEIFLNDCIMRPESCSRSNTCSIHLVWDKARNQLRDTLREATFEKILRENSCLSPEVKIRDEE